jgi:hypothetical protein
MSDDLPPGADPGWSLDARMLLLFVPIVGTRLAIRRMTGTSLGTLRALFLNFLVSLLMVGVVVLILGSQQAEDATSTAAVSGTTAALGVFVLGLVGVTVSWRVGPALPCDDLGQLLGQYRTRFFLRIAFAEAAALFGFVGFFLSANPMPYFVGLLPALLGFAMLAPTQANLEREDAAMRAQGCRHTIYRALLDARPESG